MYHDLFLQCAFYTVDSSFEGLKFVTLISICDMTNGIKKSENVFKNASDILLIDIRFFMMCAGNPHSRNAISTSVKLEALFESALLEDYERFSLTQ